jgi:hypothetical protein
MKNGLQHLLLVASLVFIRALVLTPDEILVRNQLGYLPPNYRQVSACTEVGVSPVAIQTYPLNGGAPRRQRKAVGVRGTLSYTVLVDLSRYIASHFRFRKERVCKHFGGETQFQ